MTDNNFMDFEVKVESSNAAYKYLGSINGEWKNKLPESVKFIGAHKEEDKYEAVFRFNKDTGKLVDIIQTTELVKKVNDSSKN